MYTRLEEGVQYATPAVAVVFVAIGAVVLGTAMPPAVYPAPLTSPDVVYAVVPALIVAEARYSAALKLSAAVDPRMGAVPKLCVAVSSSPMNEVHIA